MELKTFTNKSIYKKALNQAAVYDKKWALSEIFLIFFVEYIDTDNRIKYEVDYIDEETNTKVIPLFVETEN